MSLFPIFLKLAGRPCLVVGAGAIAEGKIAALLEAEAVVTVVSPMLDPRVEDWAVAGEVLVQRRAFTPQDADNMFLVVAATDEAAVNRSVFHAAKERGILCNAVDDPPFCDFYFPSVVKRGDLQVAISTAGESPALAQQLRKELNQQLPHDLGPWLTELGRLRREVLQLEPLGEPRKLLLHQLAQREVCGAADCPSRQIAQAHAASLKDHA